MERNVYARPREKASSIPSAKLIEIAKTIEVKTYEQGHLEIIATVVMVLQPNPSPLGISPDLDLTVFAPILLFAGYFTSPTPRGSLQTNFYSSNSSQLFYASKILHWWIHA